MGWSMNRASPWAAQDGPGSRTNAGTHGRVRPRFGHDSLPAPAGATRSSRAVAALGLIRPRRGRAGPAAREERPAGRPAPPPAAAPTGPTLSLGECIAIGLERNPTVKAAVHSLNAARRGNTALGNLPRYATLLKKDIPVRQQQSAHGVTIAEAEVRKAQAVT